MTVQPGRSARGRSILAALASSAMLSGLLIGVTQSPAAAALTSVKGSACSYWVNVGLFGGPQTLNGCGEAGRLPSPSPAPGASDTSYSPHVALPANGTGSATAITATDTDGAKAQYGPAVIHGGIWPENVAAGPPSGPQFASTEGTPSGGTVTSIAEIKLHNQPYPTVTCASGYSGPCYSPGGFGPMPVWGDSLKAECTANEQGVTGKTTFSKSFMARATDPDGAPLPSATVAIPANPPPNYTLHGVITNVGDVFTVVFNQQIVNPDKSLTVNAVHMYLFGPTAVGEVVRGQVTCGTTPSQAVSTDTVAPTCGTPVVRPVAPADPTPMTPRTELVGVFDAGGLKSITKVRVSNGRVDVGSPDPNALPYLHFTSGQTGPLPITAERIDEARPMFWSFVATDMAGRSRACQGVQPTLLYINDVTVTEGNTGTKSATFRITRAGHTAGQSTVKYATAAAGTATAGSDYTAIPLTTLTFAPGDTSKTVSVKVIGDTVDEANERFSLGLSSPVGAALGDSSGVGTIVDDEGTITPGPSTFFSIADVAMVEGNSGSTNVTFYITRTGNLTVTSNVQYATMAGTAAAGTDFTAIPATSVSFAAGQTAKAVTVKVIGDTVAEPNEQFTVVLSAATNAVISDPSAAGTVFNDD